MTMRRIAGISQQRSFWLRCFLGAAFFSAAVPVVWAKVEPQGSMHLWRLHGFYMNAAGQPIDNAELTLQRDGRRREICV